MADKQRAERDDAHAADGRRRRGDRTRAVVARRAAELASLKGLEAVSLGDIAADLNITKSGIQAVFPSKQDLQLAAVRAATDVFVEHVVAPAMVEPKGLPRLRALIEGWLGYVGNRVLPGGCFLAATVPEFDSRPGPVRDALSEARRAWLGTLEREVRNAQAAGELADDVPAELLAFEIDALLSMGNTVCNLSDHPAALQAAGRLLEMRLSVKLRPRKPRRPARTPA